MLDRVPLIVQVALYEIHLAFLLIVVGPGQVVIAGHFLHGSDVLVGDGMLEVPGCLGHLDVSYVVFIY